jgi:hypothetical protein
MLMGERVGHRLMTGAVMVQKWAVLPVSAMAAAAADGTKEGRKGGPRAGGAPSEEKQKEEEVKLDDTNNLLSSPGAALGFPLGQVLVAGRLP